MTFEEHTKLIQDIRLNLTDEAKVTEALTKLSEDYGATLKTVETEKTTAATLTKTNEDLRKCNMELFLKVGSPTPANTTKPGQTDTGEQKKSFESLFDEKGKLK